MHWAGVLCTSHKGPGRRCHDTGRAVLKVGAGMLHVQDLSRGTKRKALNPCAPSNPHPRFLVPYPRQPTYLTPRATSAPCPGRATRRAASATACSCSAAWLRTACCSTTCGRTTGRAASGATSAHSARCRRRGQVGTGQERGERDMLVIGGGGRGRAASGSTPAFWGRSPRRGQVRIRPLRRGGGKKLL